jgi:hypothetical protein
MNHRATKYILISLLIASYITGPLTTVFGASTNWVSTISIQDETSKTPVPAGQPLLAGDSYNVTIQVDVPFTQGGSNFNVSLSGSMSSSATQYWYLLTKNYGGFDSATFTPGEKSVLFNQVEGKIRLSVLFQIPADITTKQALGQTYRFMLKNYPLIQIRVTGGSIVGFLNLNVSDPTIENYLVTVSQKAGMIAAGQIDKTYEPLVIGILSQADAVYSLGLPEKATDILNLINTVNFPAPPNNSLQIILIGALVLVAVAAILGFLMFSRANSKAAMKQSAIDDTRNQLAGLEVTAARYDESLAGELKRLRDKLEEA